MRKIALFLVILMISGMFTAYGDTLNPSRQELEEMITEVAIRRGIPSVLLMSIARVESVFRHYNSDGTVSRSYAGSIGLMQIHNSRGLYDEERLMYDIPYNIEVGAEILLEKWAASAETPVKPYWTLPSVGNMDPNVFENWYFALWGYNGFASCNNPNVAYSMGNKYTYQDLIYLVASNEYGQIITPIDKSYLPLEGIPNVKENLNVPTPEDFHLGDVFLAQPGEKVKVSYLPPTTGINLRKEPNGEKIRLLTNDEIYTIGLPAELAGGYYWYYLLDEEGNGLGWAARNWMIHIEESLQDVDVPLEFDDISEYWGKDYIMTLTQDGIIKGRPDNSFAPNDIITREDFATLLTRSFELDPLSIYDIIDKSEVKSYAVESVETVISLGIMDALEGYFRPGEPLSRLDATIAIARILGYPEEMMNLEFEDIADLTSDQVEGLRAIYTYGIINGKSNTSFAPLESITRGEMAKILVMARSQYR
jgi:hypothetical protein